MATARRRAEAADGELRAGDTVQVTGNVRFKGEKGVVDYLASSQTFAVVDLHSGNKASFHISDLTRADEDDDDTFEETTMNFRTNKPRQATQESLLKDKKAYRKEELEDDKFYLVVDPDSADDASIDIKGGQIFFGPFDSPEDAATAAGADDANVVPGDDIDAVDAALTDDGQGQAGDMNMDESRRAARRPAANATRRVAATESARLRASVMRDIMREADTLDVDTTIKSGDQATDQASGALDTKGVNDGVTNQSATEIGQQHVQRDVKTSNEPGFEGSDTIVKPSGAGTLDSNGGDLGSVRESQGPDASTRDNGVLVEKTNPKYCTPGSFVRVYEGHGSGRKKVDQGIVFKMTAEAVTLDGDAEYPVDKYSFILMAH